MILNLLIHKEPVVYTITATLTNCSGTFPETIPAEGLGIATQITPSPNYYVTSEMVTVTGCNYTYTNGVLYLTNPTENVVVTIIAQPRTYTITTTVTNGTYSGATSVQYGSTATVNISADSGYQLPSDVTVTNATYTYDDSTGAIVITPTGGAITITAVCEVVPVAGDIWEWNYSESGTKDCDFTGATQQGVVKNFAFTSNGEEFVQMIFFRYHGGDINSVVYMDEDELNEQNVWYSDIDGGSYEFKEEYRRFIITDSSYTSDTTLMTWLNANATKIN